MRACTRAERETKIKKKKKKKISDGSGDIDGDVDDATDAVFSGDDDGFCSNGADSDSYEYVDQFDHYY